MSGYVSSIWWDGDWDGAKPMCRTVWQYGKKLLKHH